MDFSGGLSSNQQTEVICPTEQPSHLGCTECASRELCWSRDLTCNDSSWFGDLYFVRRRVGRGECLYRMGDGFESLYAVRSGFFKTRVLLEDGRDHLTSFRMSGDLLGFDGIGSQHYSCDVIALEDSEVCIIPYRRLMRVANKVPELGLELHRMMSREIVREQSIMSLLSTMQAEERVVAFLLNLSMRLQDRRHSPTCFILRMTREEIGSYLGLKLETVSRVLSRLQTAKLIQIEHNKQITLLDVSKLKGMLSEQLTITPCQITTGTVIPIRRHATNHGQVSLAI